MLVNKGVQFLNLGAIIPALGWLVNTQIAANALSLGVALAGDNATASSRMRQPSREE